jgi:hypothetical protein
MANNGVEFSQDREKKHLALDPLPPDEAEPVAYMVSRMRANKPIEGMTAMDINVEVIHIIDLAKESVKTGRAVSVK